MIRENILGIFLVICMNWPELHRDEPEARQTFMRMGLGAPREATYRYGCQLLFVI